MRIATATNGPRNTAEDPLGNSYVELPTHKGECTDFELFVPHPYPAERQDVMPVTWSSLSR